MATTSWGSSTRMLGGVIMTHGDDHGLRLPPAIAPHQVVLVPLAEGEVEHTVDKLASQLRGEGVRTHVDRRFHLSFGRRSVDWELKGVPVRVELGARELAAGQATLVRRDTRAKSPVPIDGVAGRGRRPARRAPARPPCRVAGRPRGPHLPGRRPGRVPPAGRRRRVLPAGLVRVAGLRGDPGRGHRGHHPGDPRRAGARRALPGRRRRGHPHRAGRARLLKAASRHQ